VLKNYKSIAACDVQLGPLTFLVGPNGAGKSNFLDALRFVADSLRTSLDHALRDRGGINDVRRRSGGHPTHFGVRLVFSLPAGETGHYAFRIGSQHGGEYEVQGEECYVHGLSGLRSFHVEGGTVASSSVTPAPAASSDRLYLVNASGLPEFRPVYDALSSMGFYSLNPDRIRDLQSPDSGRLLARDGSNLASVLAELEARNPEAKRRVEEYLGKIVPGVSRVETKNIGPKETLEFGQAVAGSQHPWHFLAANMSDGTLRALGILVALFQSGRRNGAGLHVSLVGIEEPELALHPAAAGLLIDGLRDASRSTQVLVTSHSPDLLDNPQVTSDSLLAVDADEGTTIIGPLDEAGKSALHDRLYTAGELLRLSQLAPDPAARELTGRHLRLFDEGDA
jgi:predicted ATPase